MKIKLLTAMAVSLSLCGYAQTKGTSALGLGVSINSNKSDYKYTSSDSNTDNKNKSFTLGYGYFNADNTKIGIEFTYGNTDNITTYALPATIQKNNAKIYMGNVTYQKYYPLVKTLYAYAGGIAGYSYTKIENLNNERSLDSQSTNQYSVGAYGGLTWFVSKRFAFETNLLSANINYAKTKTDDDYDTYTYSNKTTSFNLKTEGFIDNLGFKIYLLF